MKIVYVSQNFPPEMGALSARVHELSREWARAGHEVTVVTGFPNHPTGVIPPEYRGKLIRREKIDGIHVVRVPIYAAANSSNLKRAANYLSFSASASLVGPLVTSRPDVLIASSPQFLTGVAGWWMSGVKRVPFVFEVRDLWPRCIVELGAMKAGSPMVRVLEALEHLLYKRADHIVVVTETFVDEIAAHGIAREKIDILTNGVDLDLFSPASRADARAALGLPGGFLASYVGTHGLSQGLDVVLDAARLLSGTEIRFLLVGEGAEKQQLKERAARENITNVTFMDQQPRSTVSQIVAASNACLTVLRDKPIFRTVIPSKIFEFMGAARGIVTTVDGESRRLIERGNAGLFSPPDDAGALAELLRGLVNQPERLDALGANGRAFVEQNYSRPAIAARYLRVLEGVARRASPAS